MPGWTFGRSMESSRKRSTGSMDEANQLCGYSGCRYAKSAKLTERLAPKRIMDV